MVIHCPSAEGTNGTQIVRAHLRPILVYGQAGLTFGRFFI